MNLITARNLIITVLISLSAWWSAWALLDDNTYGAKVTVARGIGIQINVEDRTLILLSDVNASDTIDSQ